MECDHITFSIHSAADGKQTVEKRVGALQSIFDRASLPGAKVKEQTSIRQVSLWGGNNRAEVGEAASKGYMASGLHIIIIIVSCCCCCAALSVHWRTRGEKTVIVTLSCAKKLN